MGDKVTMKQEIFCQEWVDQVGNGTQSALIAFDIEDKDVLNIPESDRTPEQEELAKRVYNTAASIAREYLRKPQVNKRIDTILDERGFNNEEVKKEHFKILKYGKDEVKMRAISDYYKLKGKYEDKDGVTIIMPEPIIKLEDYEVFRNQFDKTNTSTT